MKDRYFTYIVILILFVSCNSNHVPKPRGYFRIETPEKKYQDLIEDYPFSFQYPQYAEVHKFESREGETEDVNNWLNLVFPVFNAQLYLTFKPVEQNLRQLVEDSHTFVYKHVGVADAINQTEYVDSESSVYGVLFDIKGNTASSMQFYLTDSSTSFLRGALYFDCEPNKDSLAPLINFLREDIEYLMETFSWK